MDKWIYLVCDSNQTIPGLSNVEPDLFIKGVSNVFRINHASEVIDVWNVEKSEWELVR